MTRSEYRQRRQLGREWLAWCRVATTSTEYAGLVYWMQLRTAAALSEALELALNTRAGDGLTTQLGMIRALPEQRMQRVMHVRMARYYRRAPKLP